MKRVFLILALVAGMSAVKAQEQVQFRVSYDCDTQIHTNKEDRVTNRWVLNIGQRTAEFYCKTAQDYKAKRDSVLAENQKGNNPKEFSTRLEFIKSLNRNGLSHYMTVLLWNLPETGKYTVTDHLPGGLLRYEETVPSLSWNMMDENKEIEGYACKKAQAELYGRTWTVWYTDEIPLSFGPWLLGGLPGLVLEAEDADHAFHFTLAGLEEWTGNSLIEAKKEANLLKCTRKRFLEMRLEGDTNTANVVLEGNKENIGMVSVRKDEKGDSKISVTDINGEESTMNKSKEATYNYLDRANDIKVQKYEEKDSQLGTVRVTRTTPGADH